LSFLKALYEIQASKYWCWQKLESWTLKAGSEKELLSVEQPAEYTTRICRITMPDSTPPDRVHFTIDVANKTTGEKYTIVGANPQTLKRLKPDNQPNPFGYITIYDTTNYIYAWHEPWELHLRQGETATVKLTNETQQET
jgi:hypothetical protein